jgi:hypothetical protein
VRWRRSCSFRSQRGRNRGGAGGAREDEVLVRATLEILASDRPDAYEAALATLGSQTRHWWEETLGVHPDKANPSFSANAASLRLFLETKFIERVRSCRLELTSRSAVREHAFGEALNPRRLERLGRYEVHLDRKFERTLAIAPAQASRFPETG